MPDSLGSTSWHNRHLAAFARLDELLRAAGPAEPTVLIIGPGAVSRPASPLLNDAAKQASAPRRLLGDLARYADQLLRRLPRMPLRSLEPLEMTRALSMPHRLVVVDRAQRILDAVGRDLPAAMRYRVDISRQGPPITADVVIAFNVVSRLGDRAAGGMRHVAAAVRPGGWLLIDDRSTAAHRQALGEFEAVAPKTYRRQPRGQETDPQA